MRPSNEAIKESKRPSNERSSIEEREYIVILIEGRQCTRPNRELAPRPRPNRDLAIRSIA